MIGVAASTQLIPRSMQRLAVYSVTSALELTKHSLRLFRQELPAIAKQLNPSTLVIDVTAGFGLPKKSFVTLSLEARCSY